MTFGRASDATARAREGASELAELLRLAHSAVHRVQADTDGEAFHVAERISRHLQYLRKVAELLRHEIERIEDPDARPRPARVKVIALAPTELSQLGVSRPPAP